MEWTPTGGICIPSNAAIASMAENAAVGVWSTGHRRSPVVALAPFAPLGEVGQQVGVGQREGIVVVGEETAATLGIDPERTTAVILATTALLSGAAVAIAGLVGFVGLVVPHAVRFLIGARHRRLVIASIPAGATVLVLADLAARSIIPPAELPVGVITGLVGAPFFLILLVRSRRMIV